MSAGPPNDSDETPSEPTEQIPDNGGRRGQSPAEARQKAQQMPVETRVIGERRGGGHTARILRKEQEHNNGGVNVKVFKG